MVPVTVAPALLRQNRTTTQHLSGPARAVSIWPAACGPRAQAGAGDQTLDRPRSARRWHCCRNSRCAWPEQTSPEPDPGAESRPRIRRRFHEPDQRTALTARQCEAPTAMPSHSRSSAGQGIELIESPRWNHRVYSAWGLIAHQGFDAAECGSSWSLQHLEPEGSSPVAAWATAGASASNAPQGSTFTRCPS